ncbi:capsule biosynthesis GfcC family protein [Salinicola sp. DM10]|uniref:capsule biosynthesis GfcC family protein n=1 Tax=Salinicola sp. DM10 TaxID=2815721 RepID=UPI001A8E0345|nr:capsule biosynthesis GfcC family protein [Salinicola sp. DM10]MCE3025557.1 capsule biosynthesis GfcC family protein [Salinicola sp. DM10]
MRSPFPFALGLLALGALALDAAAAPPADEAPVTIEIEGRTATATTLLEAWSALSRHDRVNWPFAYVGAERTDSSTRQTQRRLRAELDGLAMQARLQRQPALASGLDEWSRALATKAPGRIPGRVDPSWLMAHTRQMPALADLDRLGWCETPDWVEAWTPQGVTRLDWRPGMTTEALLEALPESARAQSEQLALVDPRGGIRRLGMAAWNRQSATLVPGSRVVLQLPLNGVSARWVDASLPDFLATRLPGDTCHTFTPDAASGATTATD